MSQPIAMQNRDKEIWRKKSGDYYSPSIHVTFDNKIGINVGGFVIIKDVEEWHRNANQKFCIDPIFPAWFYKLGHWLFFR